MDTFFNKINTILIIIFVLLLLILTGEGIYFFLSGNKTNIPPQKITTVKSFPTITPSIINCLKIIGGKINNKTEKDDFITVFSTLAFLRTSPQFKKGEISTENEGIIKNILYDNKKYIFKFVLLDDSNQIPFQIPTTKDSLLIKDANDNSVDIEKLKDNQKIRIKIEYNMTENLIFFTINIL